MKKILLMGYLGQLGQDLVNQFKGSTQYELILVDKENFDLTDIQKIQSTLQSFAPFDILINCSGVTDTSFCEQNIETCFKINSFSVLEMSRFCEKNGVTLFHISTDYVFSGETKSPYRESDLTTPVNVYGHSKNLSEQFIASYLKKFFIFRVSSLFGIAGARGKPTQNANFIEAVITKNKNGEALKVINDQFTCPTHTLDVARAIKYFIDNEVKDYGIYHAVNSNFCSWYDFASEIFRLLKDNNVKISAITHTEFPAIIKRPIFSALNNQKLNSYYKMPEWKLALKEYLTLKNYI